MNQGGLQLPYSVTLTRKFVEGLPFSSESEGRVEYRDAMQPGLVLRIGKRSKRYYFYSKQVGTVVGKPSSKIRLGSHPELSPAEARRRAAKLSGVDARSAVSKIESYDLSMLQLGDEFLTTAEASRLTKMSVAWFERKRFEGVGGPPYLRQGRSVRYLKSDLIAWWLSARILD